MTPERFEQLLEFGFLPAVIITKEPAKARLNTGAKLEVLSLDTLHLGVHPDTNEPNGFVKITNGKIVQAWTDDEIVWVHASPPELPELEDPWAEDTVWDDEAW